MESKLLVKSKIDFSTRLLPILIIPFGIFMLFVSQFFLRDILTQTYPQLINIIFGIITGTLGLFSIRSVFTRNWIYFIYNDQIILKSLLGNFEKSIPKKDIISWSEIKRKNKKSEWLDLVFFTEKKKYTISSYEFENYEKLKINITKDIPKDHAEIIDSNYLKIITIVIFSFFGIVCFNICYEYFNNQSNPINDSHLIIIKDEITNKPKINKGSKGRRSIDIQLKSIPEFVFDISGETYHATYAKDYVKSVKIGDTIELKILKDIYEKKITKTKPLSFLEKSNRYSTIKVYELSFKEKKFLSIEDYNKAINKNEPLYWFILILGFFSFFVAIAGIFHEEETLWDEED